MGFLDSIFNSETTGETSGTQASTITNKPYDPKAIQALIDMSERGVDISDMLTSYLKTGELPYQAAMYKANMELLPTSTAATQAKLGGVTGDITAGAGTAGQFYNAAETGVNPLQRANEAEQEVVNAMKKGEEAWGQNLGRYGISPTNMASVSNVNDIEKAKAIAGARTGATNTAEQENFNRLLQAMGVRQGTLGQDTTSQFGNYQLGGGVNDVLNALRTAGTLRMPGLTPREVSTRGTNTGEYSQTNPTSMWDIAGKLAPLVSKAWPYIASGVGAAGSWIGSAVAGAGSGSVAPAALASL